MKIKPNQIWYDRDRDLLIHVSTRTLGSRKFLIYFFNENRFGWNFILDIYLQDIEYIGDLE